MPIEMEKVLFEEPAKRFKVSLSFIQRLLKRDREEGTIAPKTLGGGPKPQLEPYTEQIHLLLEQCNDLTLEQLGQKLAQETGVKVSLSTLCRFLQKHKLTRKKKQHINPKQKQSQFKFKE